MPINEKDFRNETREEAIVRRALLLIEKINELTLQIDEISINRVISPEDVATQQTKVLMAIHALRDELLHVAEQNVSLDILRELSVKACNDARICECKIVAYKIELQADMHRIEHLQSLTERMTNTMSNFYERIAKNEDDAVILYHLALCKRLLMGCIAEFDLFEFTASENATLRERAKTHSKQLQLQWRVRCSHSS